MKLKNIKKTIMLIALLLLALSMFGCGQKKEKIEEVNIYLYDSLSWMEPILQKKFAGKKLKITKFEGTTKMYTRLLMEKKNPVANIVIGLNENLKDKAIADGITIVEDVKPLDHGALAFISKTETINSFEDLKKYDKKLLLQDPRFSTTGRDFLNWTVAAYGDNWKDYWRSIKKSVYSLSKSWDESFKEFETSNDFIMLSYATDGAYSLKNYGSVTYKVSIPKEGAYYQNEYYAIIKNNRIDNESKALISEIVEYISSVDVQKEIPFNQWMLPANTSVKLPEEFNIIPKIDKVLSFDEKRYGDVLKEWEKVWQEK